MFPVMRYRTSPSQEGQNQSSADECFGFKGNEMASPKISKIEIYKHMFLNDFTALIFLDGHKTHIARIDNKKISFKSTLETRIAGVDGLLSNPTLHSLMQHSAALVM